jgi:outer membrane protein OmpA-like peptidoglycan-associated protein
MPQYKVAVLGIAIALCLPYAKQLHAQTIGYADAVGQLAVSCGSDIDKLCKKTNLGGGRVSQCLEQNHANVSAQCKVSIAAMAALLKKRAVARASVMRICDPDIKRLCAGIQAGDGNLMECFDKARSHVSAKCRQAVSDAGYDVSLATGPVTDQIHLESNDILSSLHGVEAAAANIDAASLRKLANASLHDNSRASRMNRAPLSEQLSNHAQLTVAIQFDFDSARIRPNSFRAVGLIADALNHPYLQGYCFLVVGHTDAKGSREYNLKLSQERADAIREALVNPFGISPARIEAVGLGEEQLLTPSNPDAAENRRVQLINIGSLNASGRCQH